MRSLANPRSVSCFIHGCLSVSIVVLRQSVLKDNDSLDCDEFGGYFICGELVVLIVSSEIAEALFQAKRGPHQFIRKCGIKSERFCQ